MRHEATLQLERGGFQLTLDGAKDAQRLIPVKFSILHHIGTHLTTSKNSVCAYPLAGQVSVGGAGRFELLSSSLKQWLPRGDKMRFAFLSVVAAASLACSSDVQDGTGTGGATASGGGSASGGGTASGGSAVMNEYCDPMPIMESSCNGVACHGNPGEPAAFYTDLFNPSEGQTVGQMLIGEPADYEIVTDQSSCPTDDPELLIDPEEPSESLILKKINNTHACGQSMPSTGMSLSQDQIDCFTEWVNGVVASEM